MTLQDIVREGQHRHGAKFDGSDLVPRFAPYYGDYNIRVTVERTYNSGETYRRTGWIGKTTGWKPAFLLMSRINAIGSGDVLGAKDRIVSVRPRRVRSSR